MLVHVMFHDDDCGELLNDSGVCPKCGFPPDMQSTAFKTMPVEDITRMVEEEDRTFLGLFRRAFFKGCVIEDFVPPKDRLRPFDTRVTNEERRRIERVIWDAAISCAADEADRVAIEVGGELYRLRKLHNDPGGHCAMAYRILKLLELDPPLSERMGA